MRGRLTGAVVGGGSLALGVLLLGGSPSALAMTPTPSTSLVSRDSGAAGAIADGHEPALNANGRYVTFESAGNFGGLNPSNFTELWLRDRSLGTTQLISRLTGVSGATADNGISGVGEGSGGASVSADGRYVVFDSAALNLAGTTRTSRCTGPTAPPVDGSPGPNVGGYPDDVFLRDTVAGTTTLISHAVGAPSTVGNDVSGDPRISADGSTITFASAATNLSAESQSNPNCQYQIVMYKVATDTATIVSRATNVSPVLLGAEGNAVSDSLGSMNSDGTIIAFSSTATNLTLDSPSGNRELVFVRDVSTGITTLVSRATGAGGAPADNGCSHPTVSSDGHLVAFSCESTNLAAGTSSGNEDIYIRDRTANTITLESFETSGGTTPSTSASSPVMSADGSTVIYESEDATANGGSNSSQVMATDVASGTNTIVSRANGSSGAIGDQPNTDIATNADGSVVAFESAASNLTSDTPPGGGTYAFVRGAAPVVTTPTPTPSPTGIAVPATGAATGSPGGPSFGWLAVLGGLGVTLAAALAGRRRADRSGGPPSAG